MPDRDISAQLQEQVLAARETRQSLCIRGGGSKDFYGGQPSGAALSTAEHRGILHYEPTELVITARAGTPLKSIEQTLADNGQMLPFEPPAFADSATLGGTIACNLSGPRRPWTGAARDFVLGSQLLNGKGDILHFGGEVMKNVAGYDVSRLMAGAMGTLGVLLEISLKVLPLPETEITLVQACGFTDAREKIHQWGRLPLPLSAIAFHNDRLYVRLSGTANGVSAARDLIGGEPLEQAAVFWESLREQKHAFFQRPGNLWRLSLASSAAELALDGEMFYDWGGALRWLHSELPAEQIRDQLEQHEGHALLFRGNEREQAFHPLPPTAMRLHARLKQAFDPDGLFNPGRLYGDL
jgi:glycolate oxidase FAD binding subunit